MASGRHTRVAAPPLLPFHPTDKRAPPCLSSECTAEARLFNAAAAQCRATMRRAARCCKISWCCICHGLYSLTLVCRIASHRRVHGALFSCCWHGRTTCFSLCCHALCHVLECLTVCRWWSPGHDNGTDALCRRDGMQYDIMSFCGRMCKRGDWQTDVVDPVCG